MDGLRDQEPGRASKSGRDFAYGKEENENVNSDAHYQLALGI